MSLESEISSLVSRAHFLECALHDRSGYWSARYGDTEVALHRSVEADAIVFQADWPTLLDTPGSTNELCVDGEVMQSYLLTESQYQSVASVMAFKFEWTIKVDQIRSTNV